MNKLLVICGPTATGKTGLGLELAKKYSGQIVSADSRQVYKQMDIGTGKDLPKSAKLKTQFFTNKHYLIDGVKVWGYDLVSPKSDFSVGHFIKYAKKTIKRIWKEGGLPILVGGTGLYIKAVVDGVDTANVPRNKKLRNLYRGKAATELFEILAQLDSTRAARLNISDKNNPRRLIRAIEIAAHNPKKKMGKLPIDDLLMVGLTANKKYMDNIISKRVSSRLRKGFLKELKRLLESGVKWKHQAMQALGYKQAKDYMAGKKTKKEFVEEWVSHERQYVKKQMAWFKRDSRIKWFDISKKSYKNKVNEVVKKWMKSKK